MKFSSIFFAVVGLSTFAAALPAASPVADASLSLEKRELVQSDALPALKERSVVVNVVADVQVCIDAIVKINKKYKQKPCTSHTVKSWSAEVVVEVKALISVISAYPVGCSYPSIDVCVSIFVKLLVTIFVQIKAFIDVGGLILSLLLTVDILLNTLLGLCGDLLHVCVSLFILIEAKIQVGICAAIISGCGGLIDSLYLSAFVQLCIQAGLSLSL